MYNKQYKIFFSHPPETFFEPEPDYDDNIVEVPEPDAHSLPTDLAPTSYHSNSYEHRHYDRPTSLTQPRHLSDSKKRISGSSTPDTFAESPVGQKSSPGNYSAPNTLNRAETRAMPENLMHRQQRNGNPYDAENSDFLDEYEYRIEKVPTMEQQRHSSRKDIKNYIRAVGGVPVLPPPLPKDRPMFPSSTPSNHQKIKAVDLLVVLVRVIKRK